MDLIINKSTDRGNNIIPYDEYEEFVTRPIGRVNFEWNIVLNHSWACSELGDEPTESDIDKCFPPTLKLDKTEF